MNNFKRLFCALLSGVMLLSALASCAENDEEPADTGDGTVAVEDDKDAPKFEEASFGGEDFKFLIYDSEGGGDFVDDYIWSDGVTGSIIGDAVLDRNRLVEEKYDVAITAEECAPMSEAVKRMQAGQCDFEVIYEWGARSVSAALDGMLYNFHDLNYVDFERSYWVPGAAEALSVGDKMFITSNYISMNSLSWADIIFFNKKILEKLQYDEPYDYVYADNWTYDVYIEMLRGADEDLDGDGDIDPNDQYGAFGGLSMGSVCHAPLVEENDDGSFTLIGYTDGMVANYQKYENIIKQVTHISYEEVWDAGLDTTPFPSRHIGARFLSFGEDHCLFMGGSIDMTREFLNMKSDYGIVPSPTIYAGDEFSAGVDYCAPMFSIPMQVEDPDMVGIILEYMAYESENILLPAYYETTIKTKRMEDLRDYEMLDIVRENINYTWTGLYLWGSEVSYMRSEMLVAGHFSSVWRRYSAKGQAELDDIVEKILSIQ